MSKRNEKQANAPGVAPIVGDVLVERLFILFRSWCAIQARVLECYDEKAEHSVALRNRNGRIAARCWGICAHGKRIPVLWARLARHSALSLRQLADVDMVGTKLAIRREDAKLDALVCVALRTPSDTPKDTPEADIARRIAVCTEAALKRIESEKIAYVQRGTDLGALVAAHRADDKARSEYRATHSSDEYFTRDMRKTVQLGMKDWAVYTSNPRGASHNQPTAEEQSI